MKRLWILLLALVCNPAFAAYSLLGQVNNFRSTTTNTVNVSVTYSGGERVLVALYWNKNGTDTVTVSDGTNTYSQLAIYSTTASGQNGPQYLAIWECKSAASGPFTVTATISANTNFEGISIYRYSGLSSSASAVVATPNEQPAPGTGTDAVTSGSMTPGSAPAMVFGFSNNLTDTSIPTAGTGFTSRGNPSSWSTPTAGGANIEDKEVSTTAATAATFTSSAGTETYATLGVVIPEASGSSCTHAGWPSSGGAATVPNGTSGTYRLTNGTLGTPDCSTVSYIHSDGTVGVN